MVQILTEPKNALVKQYQKLLEYDDVDLEFTQDALEAAADRAVERGIGARGLRAVLEEVMTQIMYDVPSDPTIAKVTITAPCVTEGAQPEIIRDPERHPAARWARPPCGRSGAECPAPTWAEAANQLKLNSPAVPPTAGRAVTERRGRGSLPSVSIPERK